MVKTKQKRIRNNRIEFLWEPDRGDSDLQEKEWRIEPCDTGCRDNNFPERKPVLTEK